LFVDPDENDYNLTTDSPCIDTGDPDSPDDPDGSRADMGGLPYTHSGVVEGFVLDLLDDDPLVNAIVTNQFGDTTSTDDEGFFRFINFPIQVFEMTASHPGYNDLTLHDQQVDDEDTLEVVFRLRHPTIRLSEERIDATLDLGDSTEVELTITNQGNGPLEWQAKKRLTGEGRVDPWELRRSYSVSDSVADPRIEGVVFADNHFYVSGANNLGGDDSENMIYVLDRDGQEIDRFSQFGESRWGMRDLTWDGELIWGCADNMVIGFTTEGDYVTSFEGPDVSLSVITWDPDSEVLWVARKTGRGIYAMKRDGSEVDSLLLPRYDFRLYGLAYFSGAQDDSKLYIYHSPDNETNLVHKLNPDFGDTLFVRILEPEAGGSSRGCFITDQYDLLSWVFMCITDNAANDRIDIWQLESNLSWFTLEPTTGDVEAESSQDINLLISSVGLPATDIQAELVFNHNAVGGETILPITMSIISSVGESDGSTIPSDFGIIRVYPNPFNSSVTINYYLKLEADVTVRLFDITGREVLMLVDNIAQAAGKYSTVLSGNDLPAGLYLLKLEAGHDFSVRKIVLMP